MAVERLGAREGERPMVEESLEGVALKREVLNTKSQKESVSR